MGGKWGGIKGPKGQQHIVPVSVSSPAVYFEDGTRRDDTVEDVTLELTGWGLPIKVIASEEGLEMVMAVPGYKEKLQVFRCEQREDTD